MDEVRNRYLDVRVSVIEEKLRAIEGMKDDRRSLWAIVISVLSLVASLVIFLKK